MMIRYDRLFWVSWSMLMVGIIAWGCISPETEKEVKVSSMNLADAKVAYEQKVIELDLALKQNTLSQEEYDLALSIAKSELKLVEDAHLVAVAKAEAERNESIGSGLRTTGSFLDLLGMIVPIFFPFATPVIALISTGVKGAAERFSPTPKVA